MVPSGLKPRVGAKPASWVEFVVTPETRSAVAAARRLARSLGKPDPARLPSPLVLHGPPRLTALPRRLTSRLAAGLVVRLGPLSRESRRVLLAHLAGKRGLRLTDAALDGLAAKPTGGGVRPLLGMLEALAAQTRGEVL